MSNQTKLRRGTFQHVESELYSYHETRKEIIRLKNEILYGSTPADENVGGSKSNLPGDPTGKTAVLLTSHKKLEQLQAISDAIETTYNALDPAKQKLVRLRYWARPQLLNWEGIASQLHVSRRQAMRWRDEIVRMVAIRLGWR
ncbi:transcriptional regulator [Paenibacillus larvae]|uniref:RinA family transcriptional regulator n=6 Tax=root TaxID=1 RepID=A0A0K2CZM5_9CAUD|nr:RinA family phage transcriptional regulator [Paenibacillus larvae]YP_009196178.1 transcriptional regulator [Paenibacillus phage Vegas]ALA12806.1 RinA family transcriptional regulator [Paenibacillus phage Hayley]ALA12893.1 RinA family transcriptional regulator [Paenibacillus phage Vadim]ALA12979.1 RinA family transcriptional regulator [Paenibacillus phage Diane]QVV20134.1 transcriptional regulator [Paenibacillus phage Pahemo]ALA12723.1 RinA family transcriptional regulator [Paenibacillus ph